MKFCSKCKIDKNKSEFSKDKTKKDRFNSKCKLCVNEYINCNKEIHNINTLKWNENNKNKIYIQKKNYRKNNREKLNICIKEWQLNKYHSDVNFKILSNVRTRIYRLLKNNKLNKSINLLGCSIEEYKLYLEKQFKPEMTWDNHGEIWEIDHIKPCSSFDLIDLEQQQKCFHYTNTQPLFKTTEIAESFRYNEIGNRNKNNKI